MITGYSTVSSVVVLWLMLRYVTTTKTAGTLYPQYRATIQTAIPAEKHNYPYQIKKTDVHQPQYDNGNHS